MPRRILLLLTVLPLMGGCYSFRGPEPAFDRGNIMHRDAKGWRDSYLYERFRRATLVASGCRNEPSSAPKPIAEVCDPQPFATPAAERAAIENFMNTGYDLISSDCSNYFTHMGRNQGRSRLARELIAPIGAVITGIIAIVRFENMNARDDLIASLALATATGRSALDVYDQHFLFGADNIDAVRQLILGALAAHAAKTFQANHDSFGKAANHLEVNQAICRPSHILALVRQAITAGKVEARRSSPQTPSEDGAALVPDGAEPATAERESVSVDIPQ